MKLLLERAKYDHLAHSLKTAIRVYTHIHTNKQTPQIAEGRLKLLLERAKYDHLAHSLKTAMTGLRDRRLVMTM